MTFKITVRGAHSQPIALDFLCPNCGPSSSLADRDCDGVPCPDGCGAMAERVMSAPFGKVRLVEAVRGKWEKPERKTYLDTRKLGEGQSLEEFQAKRRKMWRDERMNKAYQEFKNR